MPASMASETVAKAGKWVASSGSEAKLQVEMMMLDREVKLRKKTIWFRGLGHCAWTLLSMAKIAATESKEGGLKAVMGTIGGIGKSVKYGISFEKYLHDKIKICSKTGMLAANNVTISRDRTKLTIASPSDLNFSKRQLKYLSKRYLKKQQLRDYLRVIAASKNSYELRYPAIAAGEEEDNEE